MWRMNNMIEGNLKWNRSRTKVTFREYKKATAFRRFLFRMRIVKNPYDANRLTTYYMDEIDKMPLVKKYR
jgi:hypothetical protein